MKRFRIGVALAVLACMIAGATVPSAAFAKDYSMGPVAINGTVNTKSVLSVTEDRTFEFDGDYTFVYWEFKKGDGVAYDVTGVAEVSGDSVVPYKQTTDPSATEARPIGTYYVEDTSDSTKISVFFNKEDTEATFRLSYNVTGGVKRYQDTGQLYWQAVGSEWGASTSDIKVAAALPVPDGETVKAGENVRAWAHGPLNGKVAIGEDGVITLTVPRVDSGTFVEMDVVFPQEWLSKTEVIPEDHLQSILDQEAKWADEANAQRESAKRTLLFVNIGITVLGLGGLAFALFAFFKWGREYKPTFNAKYLREVPTDLHPAVAGALWNWGTVGEKEFTATLMNLSVQKVIAIQPITTEETGAFGRTKEKEDYQLTLDRAKAAQLTDPIDTGVVKLLFDTVAKGKDSLLFNDIKAYGKKNPETFTNEMNDWQATVKAIPAGRGFFESTGTALMIMLFVLGLLLIAGGIIAAVGLGSWFAAIAGVGCGIPIMIIASQMRRRSPEAAELYAKYQALHNYLCDFSKLDEAPPMHVILWERFLVMAVVFGISKQVIEQMKVRVPEVMSDPTFMYMYFWIMPHGGMSAPVEAFHGTVLSTTQVAHSAMASASGAGGGFSGGGGGGFGGGGGGAG